MTVGLYFGSFNPIHKGHYGLASFLLKNKYVDQVWFVVSPCNPLKQQADLADQNKRLEMVNIAIRNDANMKASDVEFDMQVPSYTIDTLRRLSERYPEYQFSLIIGSDNALVFSRWKQFDIILRDYPIMVYPRRGYEFAEVAHLYPQMQLIPSPFYDISSTEIRNNFQSYDRIKDKISKSVYDYALNHSLYRQKY